MKAARILGILLIGLGLFLWLHKPGPDPGPKPDPKPDPKPPGPVQGFRVLFVFESAAKLSKEQLNILNSTRIAEYLNVKCVKDADGRPAWRKWDDDVTISEKELPIWKQIWEAAKGTIPPPPCVIIISGQQGETFPLPPTEEDTLKLLKRYGG